VNPVSNNRLAFTTAKLKVVPIWLMERPLLNGHTPNLDFMTVTEHVIDMKRQISRIVDSERH